MSTNKVITIQQQYLEIPNANIQIEPQELQGVWPVIVDNTENQELHLDLVETVEPQGVKTAIGEPSKSEKPRVNTEK